MTRKRAEAELFAAAMRDVKPLAKTPPPPRPKPKLGPPLVHHPAPSPARAARAHPPGVDRRTEDRFRAGDMAIDARLDLHGLIAREAHAALDRFLASAVRSEARVLLIITGKGRRSDDWGRTDDGLLKREVPRWIAAGPHAGHVLRTAPARPQHGGEGALYVLLRRKRPNLPG